MLNYSCVVGRVVVYFSCGVVLLWFSCYWFGGYVCCFRCVVSCLLGLLISCVLMVCVNSVGVLRSFVGMGCCV